MKWWLIKEKKVYRNNAISTGQDKNISTGNNTRALSFNSFFDVLNVPEVSHTKAPVHFLLRQGLSCRVQKQ